MYNRYIPQPDGSFRRSRVPDNSSTPQTQEPRREPEQCRPEPEKQECAPMPVTEPCREEPQQKKETRNREQPQRQAPCRRLGHRGQYQMPPRQNRPVQKQEPCDQKDTSVGSFLRNLLPKDFDTGDLLIVLLLLLMSGDCAEDQNSALLTLVLYLFM